MFPVFIHNCVCSFLCSFNPDVGVIFVFDPRVGRYEKSRIFFFFFFFFFCFVLF